MSFEIIRQVLECIQGNKPVVAFESAVIGFGLPEPYNIQSALACEKIASETGATPATIGILHGVLKVGLTPDEIRILASSDKCEKTNLSNMGVVMARRTNGATTVSATLFAAYKAGIGVLSTGGIGGVHTEFTARFDVSSDLMALAQFPLVVVCAGPKSILDIAATREMLEALGVPVLGYNTDRMPAFYLKDTDIGVDAVVTSPGEIAEVVRKHHDIGRSNAVLVCQPLPGEIALPESTLRPALEQAEREARKQHVTARSLTPFILRRLSELTDGQSLRANLALLERNARLAAQIARSLAE